MRGYRVRRWGEDPVWEEFPDPEPGAGEVLVEIEACGVGMTVLNCVDGELGDDPALLPRVPGHELVGRVVGLGRGSDGSLLGRRVVAYFYLSCGDCQECRAGRESRCLRRGGFIGVHSDGGYAPLVALPAFNSIPIPEGIDSVLATVVPDAVATSVHVCRTRAGVQPGDRTVVIGAGGGVGIHMVQMARLCGAEVVGIERSPAKLAPLAELGVEPRLDEVIGEDPSRLFSSGPPTAIIDLVGQPSTLAWSQRALAGGGRLVVLTTFRDVTPSLDPRALVFGESSIVGSCYCSRSEVAEAATLVGVGDIRPMVGAVARPGEVLKLHRQLRSGTLLGRGALDWRGAT